jgi:serine/threonine protein kinase
MGEGTFSNYFNNLGKIFNAYDNQLNLNVALKIEKEDKSKKILEFEYDVLKDLQGNCIINLDIPSVPRVYDFVENPYLNYIVMQLLGKNVMEIKKVKGPSFTPLFAYNILIQMLNAIEKVHNKGYIHRDIKPSNFVMCPEGKTVFIVDFGLSKLHINKHRIPFSQRKNTDFRGTVAYASINAHDKIVKFINKSRISHEEMIYGHFFSLLWTFSMKKCLGEVSQTTSQKLKGSKERQWRTLKSTFYLIIQTEKSSSKFFTT